MSRSTRALLDDIERYRQELAAGVGLDNTSAADATREHAERMADLEARHRAWLAQYLQEVSGAASEPAPTQDVAARGPGASLPSPSGSPDGHSHGQQPTNPHAAELQRAREIADMPMSEYAARRAELGVRSPTDMTHLFSQESR